MPIELKIETKKREKFVNITEPIADIVKKSGISNGLCFVFCPHTTAAITINENADPDVCRDLIFGLGKISPEYKDYRHSEGNSDAHIKASLIGFSETILIENSKLQLGIWQAIYFCEFDGARDRKVWVKIIETN